ncbi:hypothetical protein BDP55DRAFT_679088 [Colletotrichum godetiae]|uniref:Uncharacterized protein n=1 Tax=Colletotrichum godetiae TaxID=1209918 RepID=A0AAJ0ADH4_9PEZI|nr:uncharacterized protein BDP55DRAFT_679088 [Colletotrichum godetiae]KAK1659632.1 hypothetical protein BDP55DRAFT_679088 [Colletotrichum godetiae]
MRTSSSSTVTSCSDTPRTSNTPEPTVLHRPSFYNQVHENFIKKRCYELLSQH